MVIACDRFEFVTDATICDASPWMQTCAGHRRSGSYRWMLKLSSRRA
jgi:hypothetical protein